MRAPAAATGCGGCPQSEIFIDELSAFLCYDSDIKVKEAGFMKIVVLCGGTSTERDVSITTSENVAGALRECGHKVILEDVFLGSVEKPSFEDEQDIHAAAQEYRAFSGLITSELKNERNFFGPCVLELCGEADIVFIGLHGEDGEDGKVQAAFDLLRIKYTGSGYLASAVAMSKDLTKAALSPHIRMPKGIVIKKDDPFRHGIEPPCVVKPSNGGSSVGVYIVTDKTGYEQSVLDALRYDDTLVAEEFIGGRELTQGVLGTKALPPIEIIPPEGGTFDYNNKYNGRTREICPAQIDAAVLKEMSEYSLLAGEILGLEVYYRLDYILRDDGKLYALEVNSLPGMTSESLVPREAKALGMSYKELCGEIIRLSLEKY